MRAAWMSAMALLLLLPAANGRSRHCQFRVHAEANPRDTEIFASAFKTKIAGKDIAIEKLASISEAEVVSFTAYTAPDGTYGALLHLDEHGRLELDTISVEHRGGYLFIFMNGRPISEMLVDKRVSDGMIYIPSGLTAADLKLMKKDWKVIVPGKAQH